MSASSRPVADAVGGEAERQVDGGRRLADAALARGDGDDVLHARARRCGWPPPVVVAGDRGGCAWPSGGLGCGGGAFGRHDGGRRQHARHGAHRLFAGLAQRFERRAAGRINLQSDCNMSAAGGDAAHHAQRNDILARSPGSMTVSRTLRTADSVISAMSLARRLIEGMPAVTYMQRGVKAKVPQAASRCGWRGITTAAAPGAAAGATAAAAAAAALGRRRRRQSRRRRRPFGSRRPPDMEDVIRKGQERLRNLMPGGLGSFKGLLLIALAAVVIWLLTGFFRVQPNQQAIQLVFGKPYGGPVASGPALQSARPDRQRGGRERAGPAPHGDRLARRHRPQPLWPRRARDLDREPDADRRREHRRHRVRRAVADQGRVQVRLRRAQRRGERARRPPRPRCAR